MMGCLITPLLLSVYTAIPHEGWMRPVAGKAENRGYPITGGSLVERGTVRPVSSSALTIHSGQTTLLSGPGDTDGHTDGPGRSFDVPVLYQVMLFQVVSRLKEGKQDLFAGSCG